VLMKNGAPSCSRVATHVRPGDLAHKAGRSAGAGRR